MVNFFIDISKNKVVGIVVLAWAVAQILKVIIALIEEKRIDFTRLVGSGGMPSSHSSFVTSLATAVGRIKGFESVDFAITAVLALVVMYDAAGVRRSAGEQAKILNKIAEYLDNPTDDEQFMEKKLKELVGHSPFEVFMGALLGIAIAVLFT
ncbi:MAG: divergent PAP2 family protein [Clostridiaceae bacterium]|nr:divergent PAP2 family protein [Clostridiaceae bacterium]